ncbi:MAG: hypothetical protein ACRYHQ_09585 [Janthinobacterium lividum]
MTYEERLQLDAALTNSLVANTAWQMFAVKLASKGPVTMMLVQEALHAAETKLQFDAAVWGQSNTGRISAAARAQICDFRAQVADLNMVKIKNGL